MGESSVNSPIDSPWHPNTACSSQSLPALSKTPVLAALDPSMTNTQHVMHRREQSVELENVNNMYNKMLINNTGYNTTADHLTQIPSNSYDPCESKSALASKQESACLLLSPDLDTDSISDDYSLSSSSTTSLLNINL